MRRPSLHPRVLRHLGFPALLAFIWLALAGGVQGALIFDLNSTWRFQRGTNEASLPDVTAWRLLAFDDVEFEDAPAPFYYGEALSGGTVLTDMQNRYVCVFLRRTFVVTNAASISALRLGAIVEDGFVAWINGVEVRRVNVPGSVNNPVYTNTLAAAQLEPLPGPTPYDLPPPSAYLVEGTNIITVQAINTALTSTDFAFDTWLRSYVPDNTPPTIAAISPLPGVVNGLNSITVTFTEPVANLSADDLLVNGVRAISLTGGPLTYTFGFPQPAYGPVSATWATIHGITDESFTPNPFDASAPGATWQYNLVDNTAPVLADVFPSPGSVVRGLTQLEVTFSENVSGVQAADLLIQGQSASSVTAISGSIYVFQFAQPATGPVTVAWAVGHGIVDQATSPNPFGGGSWNYQLNPNAPVGDLVINEILASNQNGLADEDGEASDWIEIRNRGSFAVDVSRWSLSDDPSLPGQWTFPSKLLGPGEYLVVFASGKDRKTATGTNRFHTNFKLSPGGEFLGLYSADLPRVLVSSFTPQYPEQRNDFSYGQDANGNLRYFSTPTPDGPNGASTITGVAGPVHFSVARGAFTQPFDLVLTCPTPGAEIRFTTDGTEPTAITGRPYFGPIRMTNTMLLRAAAFRSQLLPSLTQTHTYFFNLTPAQRSLPVISIVTATSNLFGRTGIIGMGGGSRASDSLYITNNPATDYHNPSMHGIAWERPISLEYIRPEDNSGFQIDCGLRVQGSDYQRPRTLPTAKFSFRTYFRGDYGPGRLEYPIFPRTTLQNFDQLVLRAGFNENNNPFIRDELSRRLSHDMGQVASHGTFVNVFTNGGYAGFYNPCERVHEEWAQAYHGGSDSWDVISPSFATSSSGLGIVDGDRNDFVSLVNYVTSQQPTNPAVYNEIARRLDLENFVDYLLLNVYSAMGDWPQNNFRAGKDRGTNGIWRFYVWDAEWGFNFNSRGTARDTFAEAGPGPNDSGLSTTSSEITLIYQRLRNSPEFRLLWADRIQKHLFHGGALTDANILARYGEMRDELSGIFTMTDFITSYIPSRRATIFTLFNTYGLYGLSNATYGVFASSNAPAFNQHGGVVVPGFTLSMTAAMAGSTIYYTLDGTDPRVQFTGAVSANASTYTSPFTLTQSRLVRARALLNGTNWSAMTEANFQLATVGIPLRLTELMYNPTNPAHEFLEIQNVGGAPVDLSRLTFDGITFTFVDGTILAPGARLLLASDFDPAGFAARYPGATVFGYFDGNLNNGGERISLLDPAGNIIFSVDYRDNNGWPTASDGGGFSLEIIDPSGDPDDPANWRASTQPGGSPGAPNPSTAAPQIQLNEIMAENGGLVNNGGTFPDWIELYNPGASAVNIGGWSLTDDGNPRKFVFPGGTQIPALGYLVVWCDDTTNISPGLHAGFSLARTGESIQLFNAATSRVDAVSFGLQLTNSTVGRVGGAWTLNNPTPNGANSSAALAPASNLVINEWLANPPSGQSDWLELHNTAAQPVALRGLYLSNTSSVHQITSLSFIAPSGFVQLFADELVGPDHLDFKLPANGGAIVLYDQMAAEVDRVTFTTQTEGISRGRLPDASENFVIFPSTASPGASNYAAIPGGGLVINEVLARNQSAVTNAGRVADFVEFFNPTATNIPLAGFSLSVDVAQAGQWVFPIGANVAPGGYLVIWCDGGRPAAFGPADYNTGRSLDGESGGVYLFSPSGQIVSSVEYGFQVVDRSIGLTLGNWRLLTTPTPGAANSANATLGSSASLRINEWMANPLEGGDWFELFNPTALPVDLNAHFLTDDLSVVGQAQFRIAPLTFVGPLGFVRWVADNDPEQGRNHLNFSLNDQGDVIRLYGLNGASIIDTVAFGAQATEISEGRLPDGQTNVVTFPGSASPAESNYLPAPGLVINEVLTHTDLPLEDAVELRNVGTNSVNIGGWFLSDSADNFKKYRVPDNTIVAAGGFAVFYQGQFGVNAPVAFTLDSARGDEVWLSAADGAGNLTGYRTRARFGAAANGVAIGRIVTSVGVDYAALTQRTFGVDNPATVAQFRGGLGLPNAAPAFGPVVFNELMYHPVAGPVTTPDDEYIELRNVTGGAVSLFDPANPANTWRLGGGVEFAFPAGASIAANGLLLVVPFPPANTTALAAFRSKYGVAAAVPVFGPYTGQLNNSGESIELYRPDTPQAAGLPDAGYVPQLLVDKVDYRDQAPWPAGAVDGGGLSLQRRAGTLYGNEPLNWVASAPTAGAPNGTGVVPPPQITTSPANQQVLEGDSPQLSVAATGAGPVGYQWRFNGVNVPDATNAALAFAFAVIADNGDYDCVVSNPGGAALSAAARLTVLAPAAIVLPPTSSTNRPGTSATFTVSAKGTGPLRYQWRLNGIALAGETNASISRTNIQLSDDGEYDVVVANSVSVAMASARLIVLVNTAIVVPPMNVLVVTGGTYTVSVVASGNPFPFGYEWRLGAASVRSNVVDSQVLFATFTAPMTATVQNWRVVVRNLANGGTSANFPFTVTTQLDVDGDGIPDPWETSFGLNTGSAADRELDSDNDGASNWEEYMAGTDPTNQLSSLRLTLQSAGPISSILQFGAGSNRTYSVQFSDALANGWQGLTDVVSRTNARIEVVTDPGWTTNRFYRVVTPRQP